MHVSRRDRNGKILGRLDDPKGVSARPPNFDTLKAPNHIQQIDLQSK
jgi:hypothetical protein